LTSFFLGARCEHTQMTTQRIKQHGVVLAIQDTTDLDFSHHPATRGLGFLDNSALMGLKVHSTLVVSTLGVPLGLIDQQVWTRALENKGIAKQRRTRETKDKESQRWLDGYQKTEKVIPHSIEVVTITDREGDIFDLLAIKRSENSHLLIRATHNRKVNHETKYLHSAITQTQSCGVLCVEINRNPEQQSRTATLTLRTARFSIQPPQITNSVQSYNL
jgi:nitrate reductase cytochrome c-type subunit